MKLKLLLLTTFCSLAGLAPAGVAQAAPAITVTNYKIISDLPPFSVLPVPSDGPSTLQAGANPDAGSYSTFAYSNQTEDIKTALTHFAPGLLGNPTSVPRCSEADLQANACPPDTKIGTSRLDTGPATLGFPVASASFLGSIYNAVPLANEPGRLGVVTQVGPQTLVSSIPFNITPRGAHDYGLTGILTDISRLDGPPTNLQVYGLSFILNGSTNKYVRNPTSCGPNTSTGQAIGWDDPTAVDSPPYTFTTTGCESVPFAPTMSFQVGSRGNTRQFGFPPLVVKITQPSGPGNQADIRDNTFTLPIELNSNNTAYHLCNQVQVNADTCPANSKFGSAIAHSPFLHEPVSGPVYLVEQPGTALPGLLIDLNQGRAHVKVQTSSKFVNTKQIQSIATDSPQLPISDLTVSLNGGRNTGVFQSRKDLCFKSGSTYKFRDVRGDVLFKGWNGKSTGTKKISGDVLGCGPGVSAKLSRATTKRPKLTLKVRSHPDSPAIKKLKVRLRSGLALKRSKLKRGASGGAFAYVNSRTFTVDLTDKGARKATLRLSKGAVRVSGKTRRSLKRGGTKRFSAKVIPTPVTGDGTSTTAKFKVKGKKRK
jgi:hypothetical protein